MNLAPLELQIEARWLRLCEMPSASPGVSLYLVAGQRPSAQGMVQRFELIDRPREGARQVPGVWDRTATLRGLRDAVHATLERMRP